MIYTVYFNEICSKELIMARLTVDLSSEIDEKITKIAKENHTTKAEVMRKAFALLSIAEEAKQRGRSIGILERDKDKIIARVVGY